MDVLFLTGAGSEPAQSIARRLVASGSRVYGFDSRFPAEGFAHADFVPVALNPASPRAVRAAIAGVLAREGSVAGVILAGNFPVEDSFEAAHFEDIAAALHAGILAPLLLVRAALPSLVRLRGTLVTITRENPALPGALAAIHTGALAAFTRALFEELRDTGVRATHLRLARNTAAPDPASRLTQAPQSEIQPAIVASTIEELLRMRENNALTEMTLRPQATREEPRLPVTTEPRLRALQVVRLPAPEGFPPEPELIRTPPRRRPAYAPPPGQKDDDLPDDDSDDSVDPELLYLIKPSVQARYAPAHAQGRTDAPADATADTDEDAEEFAATNNADNAADANTAADADNADANASNTAANVDDANDAADESAPPRANARHWQERTENVPAPRATGNRHPNDRHSADRHPADRHPADRNLADRDRHERPANTRRSDDRDRHGHDRNPDERRHSNERHPNARNPNARRDDDRQPDDRNPDDRNAQQGRRPKRQLGLRIHPYVPPGAPAAAASQGRTDIPVCPPGTPNAPAATGQARTPVLPSSPSPFASAAQSGTGVSPVSPQPTPTPHAAADYTDSTPAAAIPPSAARNTGETPAPLSQPLPVAVLTDADTQFLPDPDYANTAYTDADYADETAQYPDPVFIPPPRVPEPLFRQPTQKGIALYPDNWHGPRPPTRFQRKRAEKYKRWREWKAKNPGYLGKKPRPQGTAADAAAAAAADAGEPGAEVPADFLPETESHDNSADNGFGDFASGGNDGGDFRDVGDADNRDADRDDRDFAPAAAPAEIPEFRPPPPRPHSRTEYPEFRPPASPPSRDNAHSVLECGTSVPLSAGTLVPCASDPSEENATVSPSPSLPSAFSDAPERETEVFAQSGTEVPHSKTRQARTANRDRPADNNSRKHRQSASSSPAEDSAPARRRGRPPRNKPNA